MHLKSQFGVANAPLLESELTLVVDMQMSHVTFIYMLTWTTGQIYYLRIEAFKHV